MDTTALSGDHMRMSSELFNRAMQFKSSKIGIGCISQISLKKTKVNKKSKMAMNLRKELGKLTKINEFCNLITKILDSYLPGTTISQNLCKWFLFYIYLNL